MAQAVPPIAPYGQTYSQYNIPAVSILLRQGLGSDRTPKRIQA